MRDVFGSKQSMFNIQTRNNQMKNEFKDVAALGLFLDNHDNPRFLSQFNEINSWYNALVFSLTHNGIPFLYQGTEQK